MNEVKENSELSLLFLHGLVEYETAAATCGGAGCTTEAEPRVSQVGSFPLIHCSDTSCDL